MGDYRRFRESWGCYAQVVMGGSGEVYIVFTLAFVYHLFSREKAGLGVQGFLQD